MKRAYFLAALLPVAAMLAGCQGAGGEKYIGLPGSPAWFATAGPETVAAYFRKRCTAYGYAPGTPQMAQCIQTEAAGGRQIAARRSAEADAMISAAAQPRKSTFNTSHTQCTGAFNTVNCTTTSY
ncbi:hypothetical protein [Rhizobium sp. RAF56]|uniref:hypothetical protein n=1 Tax=Rhizobium sp. RAF56 TaxID=3233062 RepID=UPI003F9D471F